MQQLSLLDAPTAACPAGLTGAPIERWQLDEHSWVDVARGWLAGGDGLMWHLLDTVTFLHGRRVMYGRVVDEPRLTFHAPLVDAGVPPVVTEVARSLSAHYGMPFDHLFVNHYRTGADSVAWHRDRVGALFLEPLVAVLSLGAARRFLVRPRGGGRSIGFTLGSGDLLVMGGRCQHDWEHAVPKMAHAGPRMSITLRAADEGEWWRAVTGLGPAGVRIHP